MSYDDLQSKYDVLEAAVISGASIESIHAHQKDFLVTYTEAVKNVSSVLSIPVLKNMFFEKYQKEIAPYIVIAEENDRRNKAIAAADAAAAAARTANLQKIVSSASTTNKPTAALVVNGKPNPIYIGLALACVGFVVVKKIIG